ncbi:NDUFA12-domain-containing protein [Fistulina hepatica ATCC 64428]|uniref:NADH dehydrogenase [ubiquinone] 1 alpha subcomplex subunit n=1 Tax=Fistulina hepatica ATCC 64428 TaxID=1128425 RepID=A0A0D7A4I3_9AGAR|nr:NDUFA12-domain-containing protein [Fistulina hepatica ATCC 64428]
MPSVLRTLRNFYRVGWREYFHQIMTIGDSKSGRFVGMDQFGNRYFENTNAREEVPGRHRWVDYAQFYADASQIPPEWHSWLQHIRLAPPTEDAVVKAVTPPWQKPWHENVSGTRGAYKSYNTVLPKINAWEPKTAPRA